MNQPKRIMKLNGWIILIFLNRLIKFNSIHLNLTRRYHVKQSAHVVAIMKNCPIFLYFWIFLWNIQNLLSVDRRSVRLLDATRVAWPACGPPDTRRASDSRGTVSRFVRTPTAASDPSGRNSSSPGATPRVLSRGVLRSIRHVISPPRLPAPKLEKPETDGRDATT